MDLQQRQWELNRLNFTGRWCGSSQWYLREDQLNLNQPSRVIDDTCYDIHFSDPNNGIWDGRGLLFAPEGRRQLSMKRESYNSGGQCWQFLGAGGQSSLRVDAAAERFGHEVNLFAGRSRSMLVLLWGQHPAAAGVTWSLDAVGAVGFRCSNACTQEPPRPIQPPEQLLRSMEGWQGTRESWLDGQIKPCEAFSAEQFAVNPLTATFVDGLICSVPEQLPHGAFSLQIGCRTRAEAFQQISLVFNDHQSLELCERRCYSPASIEGDG